jgi:hypothetical protein
MIEIDELLLFYYFISCLEKYKGNGFLVMFPNVVFGSLQLVIIHKLYLSFKFKYIATNSIAFPKM